MHPFRAAVEANDLSTIPELFAENVVFRSPIAHRPYEGRDMVALILGAVTQVFEGLEYEKEISDGSDHALIFRARVGDLELQGCDFLHTNADGLIDEFTVMLRPLRATTAFAEKMSVMFAAAMQAQEPGE
ncbi:nuclear transport factor 2 family protein [Lolliginicoccus levis]|uniref:nuclear transport factor 2 family protein n=1 Tax=Lolliginicoccus levis TaxID=2919542 RepID=UPI00241CD82C|nr:nuclear transport factor 2 family protein [Lolliginicoccus levis]